MRTRRNTRRVKFQEDSSEEEASVGENSSEEEEVTYERSYSKRSTRSSARKETRSAAKTVVHKVEEPQIGKKRLRSEAVKAPKPTV